MDEIRALKDLAVSESGFVFDPHTGATFTVNGAGKALIDGLRDGFGRRELVALLEERFEVEGHADLHRDVDEFIHLLKRNDLLPQSFAL